MEIVNINSKIQLNELCLQHVVLRGMTILPRITKNIDQTFRNQLLKHVDGNVVRYFKDIIVFLISQKLINFISKIIC